MDFDILKVECYNIMVEGQIAQASKMLSKIVGTGVDFYVFKAILVKPEQTQFTIIAKDSRMLTTGAKKSGLTLDGPYNALLIRGEEKAGALADIYNKLSYSGVQVNEAYGIADINNGYGVILYLKQEDVYKAVLALE